MDNEKDVKPASSTGEDQVVNNEQDTTPVQETQEQIDGDTPSTQEVKPEVKDNRPLENVTWEIKRKFDETIPTLQRKIDKLTSMVQQNQQQPQQPKYSKAQLMAYASDPATTTEQRLWAYTEVDGIEKVERKKEYENLVLTTKQHSETETRRNSAAQWVASNLPETTIKDQNGNFIGWNQQSPILAKANEYIGRSETLRNDPEGFMAAVKMAAFDLGVSPTSSSKLNKTIGQLRKEQKKQLASTGGTKPIENSDTISKTRFERLKQEYAKTGSKDIFAEMIKMKKLNPFV